MSEARVKVSLNDIGTIEIEGTEAFVGAELDKFRESMRAGILGGEHPAPGAANLAVPAEAPAAPEPPPAPPDAPAAPVEEPAPVDMLEDIFAVTDTGVRILTEIPGYRVYEKMANAGKLLAHGIARLTNRTIVRFDEVTAACKAHHCYDGTHMASALKDQKLAFVFGGRGKRQTLTLTESGTRDAEKLVEKLRAAGSPRQKTR